MHFIGQRVKCFIQGMLLLGALFPAMALADWEMAQPQTASPSDPFFQAGSQANNDFSAPSTSPGADAFPNQYANLGTPAPVYAISISGSLKQNLERIFSRYHWKVVWKAPYDYNFDGRVTGASVPDVLEKLLKSFPLQAVMYMSNRTMVIIPRPKEHE